MARARELSRSELLALKEMQLTGQITNRTLTLHLRNDDIIVQFQDGRLQLTAKGRRMLVRGSPSLWDFAS